MTNQSIYINFFLLKKNLNLCKSKSILTPYVLITQLHKLSIVSAAAEHQILYQSQNFIKWEKRQYKTAYKA